MGSKSLIQLNGKQTDDLTIPKQLEKISALSITDLRQLYRSPLWSPLRVADNKVDLLQLITISDANQKIIVAKVGSCGKKVLDRVSGR